MFGEFCHECQECPIELISGFAMSSNCSKMFNHFCPMYPETSKICMDRVNTNITDYCSGGGVNHYWKCPKANKGLEVEQCYDT